MRITINGDAVKPVDPLFLHEDSLTTGAEPFQDTWTCEVSSVPGAGSTRVGQVHVSFSELPVHRWSHLPNQEKRRLGVSDGAGVSIVRADREVDYGWFFMGAKRRENYDDWWRCEIRFDPALDEAFGITHTKQQIRPKPHLVEALQSHIEPVARALNSRTRKAHQRVATTEMSGGIESKADGIDHRLRPIPKRQDPDHRHLLEELARRDQVLAEILERAEKRTRYRVLEEELSDPGFLSR